MLEIISGEETGDKSLYQNHLQSAEMTRVGRIMNETIGYAWECVQSPLVVLKQ